MDLEESECKKLDRSNFIKFQCRLDSSLVEDVHRDFSGIYYPDSRALTIFEVRNILGKHKNIPVFKLADYVKSTGEDYLVEDFQFGNKICLGSIKNQRDAGNAKTFVIGAVDDQRLTAGNDPALGATVQLPQPNKKVLALRQQLLDKIPLKKDSMKLAKMFVVKDGSGVRKCTPEALTTAFHLYCPAMTAEDLEALIEAMDTDDDDLISYEEFQTFLRGDIGEVRKLAVAKAFRKIDYNADGYITHKEMSHFYNVSYHPKLQSGQATEAEVLNNFFSCFDGDDNGYISWQEFEDYYNAKSAKIQSDQEFIEMLARSWNLDNRSITGCAFH